MLVMETTGMHGVIISRKQGLIHWRNQAT